MGRSLAGAGGRVSGLGEVLGKCGRMKELCIAGGLAFCVFVAAFYQSYRDKQRWKRITEGMSLFGDRHDIPPLVLDGGTFEAHERNVLVIWGDLKPTAYYTMADARKVVEKERAAGARRVKGVRIFAWDGESWKQRV